VSITAVLGNVLLSANTSPSFVAPNTLAFPPSLHTTINDSGPGDTLRYPFKDYSGNRKLGNITSPLFLRNPSNIKTEVKYDPKTGKFVFYDKIGNLDYRRPESMTFKEYNNYSNKKAVNDYWQERSALETGKTDDGFGGASIVDRMISKDLIVPLANFDRIMGSNKISIKPQGSAELIFGLNISNVENPILPADLQRTITFDFDEKIKMGVTGQIGDKMKIGINYDTEATFDFENQTSIAYEGNEDEIIQKIEAGNVSMPLSGSLITGSQSLFGLKTALKFGNLTVTSVVSQQKGESSTIEVKGGAMTTPYEVTADDYESGKHFFLSHYFRDNYNNALSRLPIISSNINITRIEVWVTNRSGNFENSRNIVSFVDLGENAQNLHSVNFSTSGVYPDNSTNSLYNEFKGDPGIRDINRVSETLAGVPQFTAGTDFEKVQNARMLKPSEFTYNPSLGYISLNSALNADEVLSVAYEYTAGGQTNKVGEFAADSPDAASTIIVKMLKSTLLATDLPTWDLMMKNVYSIGAYQVNNEDFSLNVMYRDDATGSSVNYLKGGNINGQILLRVLGLDNMNKQNLPGADGFFDFIDKITINPANGRVYFPLVEPFGNDLKQKITGGDTLNPELNRIAEQYVFQELYDMTQSAARQVAEKNKFFLEGQYKSSGGSKISLNAMNVPEGSVTVTAGGQQLIENQDFTVDYNLGFVTILNHGLLESGTPIKINLESNSMFNIGTKTLLGSHLDYRVSDNFNIGGTVMRLSEKPMTSKVSIGNEPIANTIWGLDMNYNTEVPLLTRIIDKIPLIDTKEMSTFDFTGEYAQLIPGHPKVIGETGYSFVDDFEGTKTTIDLKTPSAWVLASTPQMFPEGSSINQLEYGYNRAKFAWYSINQDFLRNTSSTPSHITEEDQENHLVREVYEKEIFPNRDPVTAGIPQILSILNLGFYPKDKGPYNYETAGKDGISAGVNSDGSLADPESRWGGIMRSLITNDFEEANIEYIEFWMLDPFVYNESSTGGDLYFNLGNVSEDILKDSRQSFENGFPKTETPEDVDETVWGRVPLLPRITDGFANTPADARTYQDVGLDGLVNADELNFFSNYLDTLSSIVDPNALAIAESDPSNDDYLFFKDPTYDDSQTDILGRYKQFNNHERNSAIPDASAETSTAGQQYPDMEDINKDYTLNENEAYFQYRVHLTPSEMQIGENFITDIRKADVKNKDQEVYDQVNWYQFKVPISEFTDKHGAIQDFKSIRFMRMFMHGWSDDAILRFAKLDLVRGEWRKYQLSMLEGGENTTIPQITDAQFDVSAVNIEENSNKQPVNYILPPGVTREISPDNPQLQELNEQAIVLKVGNLDDGDARAVYKNVSMDVRQYKRLQMFIHAEAIEDCGALNDNEVSAFIRLGSDYKENYYEYEIPLTLTPAGFYDGEDEADKEIVWKIENMLDLEFEVLQAVKQRRNSKMREVGSSLQLTSEYSEILADGRKATVIGNPNISNLRTIMIGVRNPADNGVQKCAEVWFNELRLSDFREDGGWAAIGRVSTKLADFATFAAAGNISTTGFGSIEQKVNERQKSDDFGYDLSSNVEFGKFFPKKFGVKIPVYASLSESFSNPQYYPLDPDILFETVLADPTISSEEKNLIKKRSQDYIKRRSINVTNIKINGNSEKRKKKDKPDLIGGKKGLPGVGRSRSSVGSGKKRFYHVSNWTASYGYNETLATNINTDHDFMNEHRGSVGYNFSNSPKNIQPFKKFKIFRPKPLRIIKDFNFYYAPSLISFRTELKKQYHEIELRDLSTQNSINEGLTLSPTFDKQFTWNRTYDIKYKLSRGIKLDFSATNSAWVQEPYGRLDKDAPDYQSRIDTTWNSLYDLGRTSQYTHKAGATWAVPINKLPLLGWTSLNARYNATYNWDIGPAMFDSIADADAYPLGHTIKNSQNIQLNSQFNFAKIYRNVKYLKSVDDKFKRIGKPKKPKFKNVTGTKSGVKFKGGKGKKFRHGLKTLDMKVIVKNSKGRTIQGVTDIIDENNIKFTPKDTVDLKDITLTYKGKKEIKENFFTIASDYTVYALMGVRNVSVSYSENNGTILPGYMKTTRLFGLDNSWKAPGYGFVFGKQNDEFGEIAAQNNWLSPDTLITTPVSYTKRVTLDLRATIEPIAGFRIDVSADRTTTSDHSEFWVKGNNGQFFSENPVYGGNYSISYNTITTSFWKVNDEDYSSKAFSNFLNNREVIAGRLATGRQAVGNYNPLTSNVDQEGNIVQDGYPFGYSPTSQEVMIPAFLAAYSGGKANSISTNPFPKIPFPNWRAKYDGLSKYPFIKKFAKKITFNHGYTSKYTVGNFTSSPEYDFETSGDALSDIRDELSGMFIPENIIDGISIDEKFVPLIGIDFGWKNNMTTKIEYKQARNLMLSFANNQILETTSKEYSAGIGYKYPKLKIPFTVGGKPIEPGDFSARADFAMRDMFTLVRRIQEEDNQLSAGQKNFTLKISADYQLGKNFVFKLFFDQAINTPRVSTSYKTTNTKVGMSIRFNLI